MRAQPHAAVLALALLAAGSFLATHVPFGFYSPDGSYHAAKLLRTKEGQPFLDPIGGTFSIYPAFFHWWYGFLGRVLDLGPLPLYRAAGLINFLGLHAAFFFLARVALRSRERAAFATLALPLLFYAPSGRHILLANPANLGLPLLLAGCAFLVRSLRGSESALLLGLFLVSLAANVVWYLAIPAAVMMAVRMFPDGPWRRPSFLAAALCAALLPCAFTAWQIWTIREVLPAYQGWGWSELRRMISASPEVLPGWASLLVDKGNARFEGVWQRSALAWVHYFVGVVPFAAFVCLTAARRAPSLFRDRSAHGARFLLASGALTLLLSLGLAITRDFPRVASVQFAGWSLLALVALEWLLDQRSAAASGFRLAVAGLGAAGLAATVLHTDRPFEADPPKFTRAVIEWVRSLPAHEDERIWVSEGHLRELIVFVTFKSFVNHVEGRYHVQDPESSARLLAAYRTIRDRSEGWREALRRNDVRYLAFRHTDTRDREIGLFYLERGRAVLQNPEWWVIDVVEIKTR